MFTSCLLFWSKTNAAVRNYQVHCKTRFIDWQVPATPIKQIYIISGLKFNWYHFQTSRIFNILVHVLHLEYRLERQVSGLSYLREGNTRSLRSYCCRSLRGRIGNSSHFTTLYFASSLLSLPRKLFYHNTFFVSQQRILHKTEEFPDISPESEISKFSLMLITD